MAKNSSSKQVGSASSSSSGSSTIADLFGPNPNSSTSASTLFGSVFDPPSMGRGRDTTHRVGDAKHGLPDNGAPGSKGEGSKGSYYQQKKVDQPCYYTSSIYYGGQDEVYSPTTRPGEPHFQKDEPVDEDPKSALRGNWWQGSYYY